ncbi:MAG TPA: SDR family oxidoreductase [Verrucomicrobiae bacterium]|nr:SDR family oxidoreductase [Verrucomicrobiae bacterium]
MIRILVLGATGLLGNAMLRFFADSPGFHAVGTARTLTGAAQRLRPDLQQRLVAVQDVLDDTALEVLLGRTTPHVIINCIGLVKQLPASDVPVAAIAVNALLPHQLARAAARTGARLVHVSTDCVFSGGRGGYTEADPPDAQDLYGLSKRLGEVTAAPAITLRTSIVGHELGEPHGLVGWFLAQRGVTRGYRRAVFSGLPTVELARVIRDYVIPAPDLSGLHHVAAEPIAKFDLLRLVAREYGSATELIPVDEPVIDRSLDGSAFSALTGYVAPAWPRLVQAMREFG